MNQPPAETLRDNIEQLFNEYMESGSLCVESVKEIASPPCKFLTGLVLPVGLSIKVQYVIAQANRNFARRFSKPLLASSVTSRGTYQISKTCYCNTTLWMETCLGEIIQGFTARFSMFTKRKGPKEMWMHVRANGMPIGGCDGVCLPSLGVTNSGCLHAWTSTLGGTT